MRSGMIHYESMGHVESPHNSESERWQPGQYVIQKHALYGVMVIGEDGSIYVFPKAQSDHPNAGMTYVDYPEVISSVGDLGENCFFRKNSEIDPKFLASIKNKQSRAASEWRRVA